MAADAQAALVVAAALLVGAGSLIASQIYQHRIWLKVNADLKPLFPSDGGNAHPDRLARRRAEAAR